MKKAACSLKRRYKVTASKPKSCKTKKWGVYTKHQAYAKALAVMLKCKDAPQVHSSGMYGHYHDSAHKIHIWYGNPIFW